MFAVLTMLDGTQRAYEVTPLTFDMMKSEFDNRSGETSYPDINEGRFRVNWGSVRALGQSDDDPTATIWEYGIRWSINGDPLCRFCDSPKPLLFAQGDNYIAPPTDYCLRCNDCGQETTLRADGQPKTTEEARQILSDKKRKP